MTMREIIEIIMSQHWDMAACPCWICKEGHKLGCRPRGQHLRHNAGDKAKDSVHVDGPSLKWYPERQYD